MVGHCSAITAAYLEKLITAFKSFIVVLKLQEEKK